MENQDRPKIGLGLLPLPEDRRYFKVTKLLGTMDLSRLPDKFIPEGAMDLPIKNQGMTMWCTAFSATTASSLQEGVDLDPAYQAAKIAQIRGENGLKHGASNKQAVKSLIEFGSIKDTATNLNSDNPDDWPLEYDQKARKHRKRSYFMADGYNSTFDAIRAAMWQNRAQKCLVMSGADWRPEWTKAKDGILPKRYAGPGYPHAFVIVGWKRDHLICHLSNGDGVGHPDWKGRFFMPREVADRELNYGNLLLVDIDPERAKQIVWPLWLRIWECFKKKYIGELFHK